MGVVANAIGKSHRLRTLGLQTLDGPDLRVPAEGRSVQGEAVRRWRTLCFFLGEDESDLDAYRRAAEAAMACLRRFTVRFHCAAVLLRGVAPLPAEHAWARFLQHNALICHRPPAAAPPVLVDGERVLFPQAHTAADVADVPLLQRLRHAGSDDAEIAVSAPLYPASVLALDTLIGCAMSSMVRGLVRCWEEVKAGRRETDGTLTWPVRPFESFETHMRSGLPLDSAPRAAPSGKAVTVLRRSVPNLQPARPDWLEVKRLLLRHCHLTPAACESLTIDEIAELLEAVQPAAPETSPPPPAAASAAAAAAMPAGDIILQTVALQTGTDPKLLRLKLYLDVHPDASLREIEAATGVPKSSVNHLLAMHRWIAHPPRGRRPRTFPVDPHVLSQRVECRESRAGA